MVPTVHSLAVHGDHPAPQSDAASTRATEPAQPAMVGANTSLARLAAHAPKQTLGSWPLPGPAQSAAQAPHSLPSPSSQASAPHARPSPHTSGTGTAVQVPSVHAGRSQADGAVQWASCRQATQLPAAQYGTGTWHIPRGVQ